MAQEAQASKMCLLGPDAAPAQWIVCNSAEAVSADRMGPSGVNVVLISL